MALPNSWTFKRTESHGIYFSDLDASVRNSVKFDIFDESKQLATLVTNNRKAFARTFNNFRLSLKTKSKWLTRCYYYLLDDSGKEVAVILMRRPFFNPPEYTITFDAGKRSYLLSKRRRKEAKEANANFIYDLQTEAQTCCTIINNRKPPFLYLPTSTCIFLRIVTTSSRDADHLFSAC